MFNSDQKKYILYILIGFVFLVSVGWLVIKGFSNGRVVGGETYEIGRDSTWYPLDLRGREKNMVGFSNDMIQAIAKDEGVRVYVYEIGPTGLLEGLNIKNYDAVFSSLPPTGLNERTYSFSNPFYLVGPVLIVRANSNFNSLGELKGRIVGVESNALQSYNLREAPEVVLIPYETASEALEQLTSNAIDGVILDALKAYALAGGFYDKKLRIVSSPITDKGLRLVTRNDPQSQMLITRFNAGLEKLRSSGVYHQLLKKWGLIDTEIPKESIKNENVQEGDMQNENVQDVDIQNRDMQNENVQDVDIQNRDMQNENV